MNIHTMLQSIEDFTDECEKELSAGNEFHAERALVKLRNILNAQPELEAGGACESEKSSSGP